MARDTFDYPKGRTIIGKFVADMDLHELTWAWAVTVDCIDIIGHHATPATEVRGPYRADMWFDWYGSFLFGADANHCIHGLAKEVRDACPPQLYPALLASVERAFAACDARTPQQRAADAAAHKATQRPSAPTSTPRSPSGSLPAPVPHPFTVLTGGKE